MGSPCWGAPQQGLMAPTSSEFPDVRLQYQFGPQIGQNLRRRQAEPVMFGISTKSS